MMKTEVSINGQDYSCSNNGLQIETENEIMQTDVMGTTRMIISRK